jgi:hypothetical protein
MDILDLATPISIKMPAYGKNPPPSFRQTSMLCHLARSIKRKFAGGAMDILDLATPISIEKPAYSKNPPPSFRQTSMLCHSARSIKRKFAGGAMDILDLAAPISIKVCIQQKSTTLISPNLNALPFSAKYQAEICRRRNGYFRSSNTHFYKNACLQQKSATLISPNLNALPFSAK